MCDLPIVYISQGLLPILVTSSEVELQQLKVSVRRALIDAQCRSLAQILQLDETSQLRPMESETSLAALL